MPHSVSTSDFTVAPTTLTGTATVVVEVSAKVKVAGTFLVPSVVVSTGAVNVACATANCLRFSGVSACKASVATTVAPWLTTTGTIFPVVASSNTVACDLPTSNVTGTG